MEKLIQYLNLNNRRNDIKKFQHKLRKKEMDRIFEEYLRNDYFQRFKVEKNIVLSALIGEDNILPELNKQMREAKKYIDSLKSVIMHKKGGNNEDPIKHPLNFQNLLGNKNN